MGNKQSFLSAALLCGVGLLGILGLIIFEIFGVLGEAGKLAEEGENGLEVFSGGLVEAGPTIVIIFAIASLPITLLAIGANIITKWVSFVIALLLFLFNAVHIYEHAAYGDYFGPILMLFAGVIPYGAALYIIFQTKLSEAADQEG
ncbi:MAG: hypothetical protein AAFQ15_05550 [Pseudomonadota bacterium]